MGIPLDKVIPYVAYLVGFIPQTVTSEGKVTLPISVKDIGHMVEFLIISAPSPYNCILGRPSLNQFQANISTYELSIDISIGDEIYMIYDDRKTAKECYFATMQKVKREEKVIEDTQPPRLEPKREHELFVLDKLKPEQMVRIGRDFPLDLQMKLVELLIEYMQIFAWSSNDLGVIFREFAEHKLESLQERGLFPKEKNICKTKATITLTPLVAVCPTSIPQ